MEWTIGGLFTVENERIRFFSLTLFTYSLDSDSKYKNTLI